MATTAQRDHLAALMRWLIGHEKQIHYRQKRPMTMTTLTEQQLADIFKRGGGIDSDCSETVTALCKWAGLADPSGLHYNGSGNSATMFRHLPHYTDASVAQVGAIVTFGPGGSDHVCMVMVAGRDPMLFSHGQEKGPLAVRFSVEKAAQRRPATFLNVGRL